MTKIPVLLFCRVSSDQQSYSYQLEELREYCEANNYEIVETIANNISGRTGNKRPDLDHLFSLTKKGGFQKVIVTSVERLGRDARMIRRTIDFLHERRISVVFKNQNFESLDANGEETFVTNILISVYAEVSMEDNKQRSAKIRSGLAHAIKKGKVVGRPVGWKKDNEALLKEHAKLVRDLKQGLSLNQCVKLHSVSKNTVIKVKRAIMEYNHK
ncbi:recombinase family protein [Pontibacter sp. HSC-14F20]|uniref:recombinase family protein n=1 Tax=Pontibacter sp. HSC-14F20 TaxID=2864136 RepID=UPI001C73B8F1|nr:recombinase family protein [Pontibacter sp. HSC-14F20]MBX0335553.1 recombinase family protein [Pontibacter sp. HSC-14F20]